MLEDIILHDPESYFNEDSLVHNSSSTSALVRLGPKVSAGRVCVDDLRECAHLAIIIVAIGRSITAAIFTVSRT